MTGRAFLLAALLTGLPAAAWACVHPGNIQRAIASASKTPAEPVRAGSGSMLGTADPVTSITPILPLAARRQGITGPVLLEVEIDRQGRVSVRCVLRGNPLLNRAAENAVRQWKYKPVSLNGKTVSVIQTVSVRFRRD